MKKPAQHLTAEVPRKRGQVELDIISKYRKKRSQANFKSGMSIALVIRNNDCDQAPNYFCGLDFAI